MRALLSALLLLSSCSVLFTSDGEVDGPAVCESSSCVANGGSCNAAGTCRLDCTALTPCECPEGVNCEMRPADDSAGIVFDCSLGTDCRFGCDDDECREAEFRCGSGACGIACIGQCTCLESTIACSASNCTLDCSGLGACQDGTTLQCADAQSCELDCRSDACANLSARCERSSSCSFACDSGVHTCSGADLDCSGVSECSLSCPEENLAPCS